MTFNLAVSHNNLVELDEQLQNLKKLLEEGERTKLRERQSAIEADIERACQVEDYDRASMPLYTLSLSYHDL